MDFKEQGLAIRGARLGKRMTQAHLAGLSGVSEKTVRRAEAGEKLQADSIRALCAALGIDASELRTEQEIVPDVDAVVNTALVGQAARVRTYARILVVTSIVLSVAALFRDNPMTYELLGWGAVLLGLVWLGNILLMVVPTALYRRSDGAKRFVDRWRDTLLLTQGFILSMFLPVMVWLDASGIAEVIRQPGFAAGAYLVVDLALTWYLVNIATNDVLALRDDPGARRLDPLSEALRPIMAALVNPAATRTGTEGEAAR